MKAVSRVLDTDVVKVQIAEDKDSSATDMIVKVEQLSKALGKVSTPFIVGGNSYVSPQEFLSLHLKSYQSYHSKGSMLSAW